MFLEKKQLAGKLSLFRRTVVDPVLSTSATNGNLAFAVGPHSGLERISVLISRLKNTAIYELRGS